MCLYNACEHMQRPEEAVLGAWGLEWPQEERRTLLPLVPSLVSQPFLLKKFKITTVTELLLSPTLKYWDYRYPSPFWALALCSMLYLL